MKELEVMTDPQLKAFADQAYSDLKDAAEAEYGSDWHESCLAAVLAACMEMNLRQSFQKTAGYLQ